MASNSDIFDKIRIKPRGAKKKEEETRSANQCAWEGCENPGAHRAPMGRNREGQYLNFCLDHVRQYNKNFNYFSGLADDEIARYQKKTSPGTGRPGKPAAAIRAKKSIHQHCVRHRAGMPRSAPDIRLMARG